jgi:ribA/ribD-fused uncharacterized protein
MKTLEIYDREHLIAEIDKGRTFEYFHFYGHQPSKDGSISASCCSQWFPAPFEIEETKYLTAEHFMMAEKARLFKDEAMLHEILKCQSPAEAKAYGRRVQNFDPEIWKKNSTAVVVKANRAKFTQNEGFTEWLIDTAPKILVEASPRDRIWGIGMGKNNLAASDPKQWRGQNLLGFALTRVRDSLL